MTKLQTYFQTHPDRCFYAFAFLYCVVWFLLPFLVQANVRPDTVEQFFFGKEWTINATKHPILPSKIIEIGYILTGGAAWSTYFVSALTVFVMLWAIWKISRKFLPAHFAFLAILASCNYRYLNIASTYFHNAFALLPFWILTIFFFYNALESGKLRFWILAGITTGCGLLCYYPMILAAITCFLFVMGFSEIRRKYWGKLILTTLIAFLIFLPHLVWVFHHGFSTFRYMESRGVITHHWYHHLAQPCLFFLIQQLVLLLPVLISIFPVLELRKPLTSNKSEKETSWKFYFFPCMVWIPVLFQVAYCVYSGNYMLSRYGSHLWLFFPLFALCGFSLTSNPQKIRQAFCCSLIVMFVTMAIFAGYWMINPFVSRKTNDTLFPGKQLAAKVEQLWHEKYSLPIPYAAGEWQLSGNLALYGKDRPTVIAFGGHKYFGTEKALLITPWVTTKDLYEKGGVILWTIHDEKMPIPANLATDFPNAEVFPSFEISPQTIAKRPPIKIGIAIVPPPK
ncbi:MAG: glycosyltransferase family 39 protein [Planctomycetaceae bacterium]|jgi:4-amino-4-deoxy-L-arabinose transferase-like glycosyltransferase|nr:glycosyltransferase family 39 protein [Planctomycetaceae bacterium]